MCLCIHVPRFFRQNRILSAIRDVVERFDLHALGFLLLVGGFPFFQILWHPTAMLLGLCGVSLLLYAIVSLGKERIILDRFDLLVLAFLLLQYLCGIVGKGSFWDAVTASTFVAVWFPARHFLKDGGEKHLILWLSFALLIVSGIGVGEYIFGRAELRWVDKVRFGDIGGRVTSFFSNPNILAVYLLLCFPFALWSVFRKHQGRPARLFYVVTAILCVTCIFFTWSRGAWLGLFLECFLFLLFYNKKSRLAIFGLVPTVLLAILFLPHSFQNRLFSIADLGESSNRYRLQTWQGTWRMLCRHPFGIGVGESAWRLVYPHYAVMGTATVPHAHNVFLQVMAEVGLVGLIVFLMLLVFALRRGIREKRFAAVTALAGTLVMGVFDHLWYNFGMLLILMTILALCIPREQKVTKMGAFVGILHENLYHNL